MTQKQKHPMILIMTLAMAGMFATPASGQEQVFFAQHLFNRMLYNPAFAGEREIPGFVFHTRQQWVSWEGSPSSSVLFAHTRLKDKQAGLGLSLSHDRMGPVHASTLGALYSYSLKTGEKSTLMMGLQGEMRLLQIRFSQLQLVDQGDRLFEQDPGAKLQPNLGLGFHLQHRHYSLGISMPRILNGKLSPFEEGSSRLSMTRRAIYLEAGSSFRAANELEINPSILAAISEGCSPFLEVAAVVAYQKRFGLGLLYRFNRTIGGMIRYHHQETIHFGYSYDLSLGFQESNVGTHELFLGYNFPFNRTKTLSPRRF